MRYTYGYNAWRGSDLACELIHEEYSEKGWELEGPLSHDLDYRNQLKEDGLWDKEMMRWKEEYGDRKEKDTVYLEGVCWGLRIAMELALTASKRCRK